LETVGNLPPIENRPMEDFDKLRANRPIFNQRQAASPPYMELRALVFVYDDGDTRRLHMAQHVKIIGILHIVFSSLLILAGVICLLVMGGIAGMVGTTSHSSDDLAAVPILGGIGGIIFVLFLILGLPGVIGGIGLIQYKPWARIVIIVLSVLDLFNIPFGTALGIYGLWCLLNKETEAMFSSQSLAARV
jgi:hypothetical protein